MSENKYYGIAWNFKSDTYNATGTLENATMENYEKVMFIHNQIKKEKDSNNIIIPEFYIRDTRTCDEIIIDISDEKAEGFRDIKEYYETSPIQSVLPVKFSKLEVQARILFHIEQGFWLSQRR